MNFPTLKTSRLRLIELNHKHTDDLFNLFSLEEVTQYYGMNRFHSFEQASKLLESFAQNYQEKRSIRWGIILKENGKLIGTIGLNHLQIWSKKAEVGYDLLPEYWRNGYITEAVKEILRYSFEDLELYRIGAVTYPENKASYQLLLKIGFQKEGTLRGYIFQNEQSHDAYIFSILKPEWETINK